LMTGQRENRSRSIIDSLKKNGSRSVKIRLPKKMVADLSRSERP
jgi:hypothetical protein